MIEVEHLSKLYGSTAAIQDVTFSVEPGEIMGFLGPNGAGKTTTMRILAGYLPATTGTAKVAGFEVHQDSMAVRQKIGYLPETPPLYPEMTIEGFLDFVARIKGVSAGNRGQRIEYALEKCNLTDRRKTLIRKLSKGFRQRVGIAQAIVHDPPVIILDEPTVGLDPKQIIDVRSLIKGLAGDHTVILSTHILPEVSAVCDRITIIQQGRVVVTNKPENLTSNDSSNISYEIEVDSDYDRLNQVLGQLPNIGQIEPIGSGVTAEGRLRVRLNAAAPYEMGREISYTLVQNDIALYEMRRLQASLEDIFLELTNQTISQEQEIVADPELPSENSDSSEESV